LSGYPVFTRKVHTDVAYLACAKTMLAAPDAIYPQFASHNAFTIAAIDTMAGDAEYEFQCLHGMGESIYDQIVGPDKQGRKCRIYAPVGSHETLLGYLVRRLLENGANTSFVNRIVDPAVHIADLVADPVAEAERSGGTPHPRIPLPEALLPGRINSRGIDLAADDELTALGGELAKRGQVQFRCEPSTQENTAHSTARADVVGVHSAPIEIRNPADRDDRVGTVVEATADDVPRAVTMAIEQGGGWASTAADQRAACLERVAELLEAEPLDTLRTRGSRGRQDTAGCGCRKCVRRLISAAITPRKCANPISRRRIRSVRSSPFHRGIFRWRSLLAK
jgi:RHH-type proline utilization regulon transcriptional repressor/proline dehydrogenase/delta 1-pyrroline-5-carboxylate dehydrogenase